MKAIILAAGRGTRLRPITDITPKPLIKIRGKSILEHLLEQLVPYVNEIILIVDYKKEVFQQTLGDSYCGVPITYKQQGDKKGTGGAIEGIKVSDDVFIAYADSIFSTEDIQALISYDGYGCLVQKVETPEKYGIFSQKENGDAIEVVEKPNTFIGNLANLGAYKFSPQILDLVKKLEKSPRGEYELTDAINVFCKSHAFKLFPIHGYFLDISYPTDIEKVEGILQDISKDTLKNTPVFGTNILLGNLKDFKVYYGISKKHIEELISYSQDISDTALQKNTSDLTRFQEVEKIEKWYNSTNRHVFTLISKDNTLAGIWWARPCKEPIIEKILDEDAYQKLQKNEKNLHTNGIRIYPEFRGMRIATPWVNICSMYYKDIFPNPVMSVDVDDENIPMQRGFEKAGYIKVGYGKNINSANNSGEKRFIYIQENN